MDNETGKIDWEMRLRKVEPPQLPDIAHAREVAGMEIVRITGQIRMVMLFYYFGLIAMAGLLYLMLFTQWGVG